MNKQYYGYLLASLIGLSSVSFYANSAQKSEDAGNSVTTVNQLTESEVEQGWRLLFDGKTTKGWHVYQKPDAVSAWQAKDGTLSVDMKTSGVQHGDLATDQEFENYELKFDWKTTSDGNSGVFINVKEKPEYLMAWQTGPEYQLLGQEHIDYAKESKRSGCLYGYSPQLTETSVRQPGDWNQSVIKQVNGVVEFYLNGNLTASVDLHSEQWQQWVSQSNFKGFPEFGIATRGKIVLQEWSSPVSFRNIKIREL